MGTLMKKIFDITAQQQEQYPNISITALPEIGLQPELLTVLREREIETQLGEVKMNCEMCKFRRAGISDNHGHGHDHGHHHHHDQDHSLPSVDPYADIDNYHQRIWQVP